MNGWSAIPARAETKDNLKKAFPDVSYSAAIDLLLKERQLKKNQDGV